ncbi:glycosyltransferase family protein [Desulfovibrio sp. QI0442]
MNILLIDYDLGEMPGHNVRRVNLDAAGIVPVQRLLEDSSSEGGIFRPDVVIQMEHIGRRILLSGLAELGCPKIFWAVDSHLNLFWQRWYGRLFDVVLTPHKSLFAAMPCEWRLRDVRSLAIPGSARQWRPHGARSHTASFVGRIDQNRHQRFRFAQLLEQRHGVVPCILSFQDMLALYDNTRTLPNESICREFNFRIMEGASCGCCVLTEDIGEDLAVNFEPGSEVLTYKHALELDDLLSFLAVRPAIAEKIGKAAQQRVLKNHLQEHRAAGLMGMLPSLAAQTMDHGAAERVFALACIQWARSNPAYEKHLPAMGALLEHQPPHPDVLAMRLRLLLESWQLEEARSLLVMILGADSGSSRLDDGESSLDLHTACAVAALRLGELPLYMVCFEQQRHRCPDIPAPQDVFQACLVWADILADTGRFCQPGFHFDPMRHCPETAFEMTQMAQQFIEDDKSARQWVQKMALCSDKTPFCHLALDYKARLSLDAPGDWRANLDYAMACLNNFLLDDGLAEASQAYELARSAGREDAFAAAADPLLRRRII